MTRKKDKIKVDEIHGYPILFDPIMGTFHCKVGDTEFSDSEVDLLKRQIKKSDRVEVNLEMYYWYGSSGIDLVKVIRLSEHDGYAEIRNLSGVGSNGTYETKHLYPKTKKNDEIYEKHKKLRDQGWKLIHQADSMGNEFEVKEKNFFKQFQTIGQKVEQTTVQGKCLPT